MAFRRRPVSTGEPGETGPPHPSHKTETISACMGSRPGPMDAGEELITGRRSRLSVAALWQTPGREPPQR